MLTEKSVLLQKLQLDPEQRGDLPGGRRSWWISGAILLFLALSAGAAAFFLDTLIHSYSRLTLRHYSSR